MASKQCSKCGEELPLTEFNRNKKTSDGLRPECKECKREIDKAYREDHREKISRYNRDYRRKFLHRIRARYAGRYVGRYEGRYINRYAGRNTNAIKRWHGDNPDARRAHRAVEAAIENGVMPKASNMPCDGCGKPAKDYHHHLGYDPQHRLNVIPLCRSCHRLTMKDAIRAT